MHSSHCARKPQRKIKATLPTEVNNISASLSSCTLSGSCTVNRIFFITLYARDWGKVTAYHIDAITLYAPYKISGFKELIKINQETIHFLAERIFTVIRCSGKQFEEKGVHRRQWQRWQRILTPFKQVKFSLSISRKIYHFPSLISTEYFATSHSSRRHLTLYSTKPPLGSTKKKRHKSLLGWSNPSSPPMQVNKNSKRKVQCVAKFNRHKINCVGRSISIYSYNQEKYLLHNCLTLLHDSSIFTILWKSSKIKR